MPELPEIETLKNCLQNTLIGRTIKEVNLQRSDLRYKLAENLSSNISSTKILALSRRAKYLLIDLDNGYSLAIHLGMSGRLTLQAFDYKIQKHDHIIFILDNKPLSKLVYEEGFEEDSEQRTAMYLNVHEDSSTDRADKSPSEVEFRKRSNLSMLVFNDARRFGMIYIFQTAFPCQKIFGQLGPEPLLDSFNAQYLKEKLVTRKTPIKSALMDNKIVVGIGNIYIAESLFLAEIHPEKICNNLTDSEIGKLVIAIKNILEKAILAGGTTIKDFVNSDSKPGYFKQELLVYGRQGQKCTKCSEFIVRIKQSGRSSFYCPNCQL